MLWFGSSQQLPLNQRQQPIVENGPIMNWLTENKAVLTVLFYVMLLAGVGLANSQNGTYFRHVFWQKIAWIFECAGNEKVYSSGETSI